MICTNWYADKERGQVKVKVFCEQCQFEGFLHQHGYGGLPDGDDGSKPIAEVDVPMHVLAITVRCPQCGRENTVGMERCVQFAMRPAETRPQHRRRVLLESFVSHSRVISLLWWWFLSRKRRNIFGADLRTRISYGNLDLMEPLLLEGEARRMCIEELRREMFWRRLGLAWLRGQYQRWFGKSVKPELIPEGYPLDPPGPQWAH